MSILQDICDFAARDSDIARLPNLPKSKFNYIVCGRYTARTAITCTAMTFVFDEFSHCRTSASEREPKMKGRWAKEIRMLERWMCN